MIDRETGMPLTGRKSFAGKEITITSLASSKKKKRAGISPIRMAALTYENKEEYSGKLLLDCHRRDELFTDDQQYSGYYVDDAGNLIKQTPSSFYRSLHLQAWSKGLFQRDLSLKNRQHHEEQPRVISNYRSGIQLLDANGQKKIAHINLISNNYGTVSGSL